MKVSIVLILAVVFAWPIAGAADEGKKSVPDLLKQIGKALEAGKEDDALAKIQELADLKGTDSLRGLLEIGVNNAVTMKVYRKVVSLLAAMTNDEAFKFYQEQAKSGKELQKTFLADVMAEVKTDKGAEVLGILAEEKSPLVQRSTIAALARQRIRGSIEPLFKILERLDTNKDHGQVYQEVRDALFEVTAQDFETLQEWKNWWEPRKTVFDPGKKPEGATQTRKPSRDKVADFAGEKKIFAKNVVFVIDTSGSMALVQKDDIPGLTPVDGSDTGRPAGQAAEKITKENERLAHFWSRIEMAKRALINALTNFDPKGRLNIIEFNTKVMPMQKAGLVAADPAQKRKCIDWVKKMRITGNTNTMEALEQAFKIAPTVTEIYFLSDGMPSVSGRVPPDPTDPILEKVESLNRFRKVKIHTFGYDPMILRAAQDNPDLVQANNFLKTLAKRTGGTFTLLKVTDEQPPKDFH